MLFMLNVFSIFVFGNQIHTNGIIAAYHSHET